MNRVRNYSLGVCLFLICGLLSVLPGQTVGVSPSDCVRVRYITGLWMSPSGKQVAYLVKAPDIERNRNEYQLFVRDVGDRTLSTGRLVLTATAISKAKWLNDDRRIALLVEDANRSKNQLVLLDVSTGKTEPLPDVQGSITSFSMDSSGTTVAYTVPDAKKTDTKLPGMSDEDKESGYLVGPGSTGTDAFRAVSLFIRHRNSAGDWSAPSAVPIENPFTHVKTTHLPLAGSLSLSPNGKRLLFNYLSDRIPEAWMQDPAMKPFVNLPQFEIMVLYDLDTRSTTLAFNSLYPASTPLWSTDSRSFLVNAPSPSGSRWQAEDIREHRASIADANLFAVNVDSGQVEEVFRHVPSHHEGPLAWRPDGEVILRIGRATIESLHRSGDSWQEAKRIDLPRTDQDRFDLLVANDKEIVGTYETITKPNELFEYNNDQNQIHLLTNLNPELDNVHFAQAETVGWTTSGGLHMSAFLFLPPNYDPGKRYPLVIQTKGNGGWFVCDSGVNHDPSFAPQPIATAGMMYIIPTVAEDWKFQDDIDDRPKGYPGGIGEAVQQMDTWDSAVEMLDKKGMIDPSRVGIIGFSRTGWEVEFDLVHAHVHYAAATAADNVQYSLSDYWLDQWVDQDYDRMYDGPPYGKTLENWRKYSLSFNVERIHTPLLIEIMGYGVREDLPHEYPGKLPGNLIGYYEIQKGLSRLSKPFEMYYYPDEQHQPDHPKARVSSLQRNLDWYRFWLQGYEDGDPSKAEQYVRWRRLKKLHEKDLASDESTSPLDRQDTR
jgi:dipeptidyl aminopeptidase/acylaminoacyl peptidase